MDCAVNAFPVPVSCVSPRYTVKVAGLKGAVLDPKQDPIQPVEGLLCNLPSGPYCATLVTVLGHDGDAAAHLRRRALRQESHAPSDCSVYHQF